jgi:Amt family ammonium transporter
MRALFDSSPIRRGVTAALGFALPLLVSAAAWAQDAAAEAPKVADPGDTSWLLTSTALVLLMTLPGLALFYGGLVRSKNVLNIFMQCFIAAGAVGMIWILFGYSLAFSAPEGGASFIGNFAKAGLAGVTPESVIPGYGTSPQRYIPEYLFVMFQAMFAIITPALILGAVAERMKFSAFLAFISLWLVLVYCPLAFMVWGGGWIFKAGAIDFAGGLVVHMSSGTSALVAALMVGKRRGFGKDPMPPHSLPLCLIGAGLLWVGWFGFNAGSALSASPLATLAFLNTSTATSTAVMTWVVIEWFRNGKPTALGAATAAVAGLVAITPACGNVSPMGSMAVGFGVSVICYLAVAVIKPIFGYDDSLDAFGVHGVGGAWGALAAGLFATSFGAPAEGTIESNAAQVMVQLKGIGFTAIFAPAMSLAILFALKLVFGSLRVSDEEEFEGLDVAAHSESAYSMGSGASMGGHIASHGAEGATSLAAAHR